VTAWRTAVPRLSRFAVEHLLLLPLGAAIALVWVNVVPESYFQFTYAIAFGVNDIAMVFFFALITKEVVEATAPGGVHHTRQRPQQPVVASIGATAVPALIHMQVVEALEEPMLAEAWPVSFAVDLAVTYFVARFIFRRHPIIPLLMLVANTSEAMGLNTLAHIIPTKDVLMN
jgi:Na+/H+ antiporter NhaA